MITNRVIQKWWDSANDADYDFMRWSDFLDTMSELRNTDTPAYSPIAGDPVFGGGGPIPINDLLAADGTNTIDNANYQQEWQWNSLAGTALKLSSTSTAANNNKLIEVQSSGTNASSNRTVWGVYASVTNGGTGATNYGGYFNSNGIGVHGNSSNGTGVYGTGQTFGVYGVADADGAVGVYAANGRSATNNEALSSTCNGSGTNNIAAKFVSTGATNNYALIVPASSGNVGFGTTAPNSKALLEMSSTTQGFLPPRMTTTQRDAISSPPEGLTVFDLTEHKWSTYNGSSWEYIDWAV